MCFSDWPLASAMAVVMGIIQAGLVIAYQLRGARASLPRTTDRATLRGGLLLAFVLSITLPLVMVLLEAFGADWFGVQMLPGTLDTALVRLGGAKPWILSPFCSIPSKSLLATAFTLAIAIPGAWAIARYRLPLRSILIGAAILFPRMIPEITFALGVARIFFTQSISPTPR